jgi:MSHA pilin protein MshD
MSTERLRLHPRRHLRRQSGVTIVELIMFMVIVSIALAGILQVMRMTTANSADPLRRKQALMIAEALLEEVRGAGFTLCDPRSKDVDTVTKIGDCQFPENFGNEGPAGTAFLRPYDNVNDYGAPAKAPVAAFNDGTGALTDALGRRMDLAGYSATVAVIPDTLGDIAAGAGADSDALRIRVTVGFDAGETVVLDGYRARYAPIPRLE